MTSSRILKFTLLLLLSAALPFYSWAQNDSTRQQSAKVRGVQYAASSVAASDAKQLPLLAGFSVSGNLAGALLSVVSSYGELEGALRANIKGTYFPIVEAGIGLSDHTDEATSLHYKTSSPFFRIGMDYNILADKTSPNRVFGGARLAFSPVAYDISGPELVDPYWHTSTPYDFKSLKGNMAWLELVFGVETKIWSIFHLGWSVRYKNRISCKSDSVGQPWYVPGFGKNGTTAIGGTFNLIFDI